LQSALVLHPDPGLAPAADAQTNVGSFDIRAGGTTIRSIHPVRLVVRARLASRPARKPLRTTSQAQACMSPSCQKPGDGMKFDDCRLLMNRRSSSLM
jgi:hypothetical protein